MVCSYMSLCVQNVVCLRRVVQRQMSNQICFISQTPSSFCFHISSGHSESKYASISVSKTNPRSSLVRFQAFQGSSLGSIILKQSSNWHSLTVKSIVNSVPSQKTCLSISVGCQNMNVRLWVPRHTITLKLDHNMGPVLWLKGFSSAGLVFGLFVCNSNSEPVHAEAPGAKDDPDSSAANFSHGKKVYTNYSVIGIPGDGRCLFRSVAHGACVRSGKPAPNESLQRELADELRARVADEFFKRRKETEW
ncbi:unnamed protein product [Ilex paraguariensis]